MLMSHYHYHIWHCWETANTVATLICIGNVLLFFRIWTAACLGGLSCTLTQTWLQQERGHLKQRRQAEARRQRLETGQSWQMQLGGLILSVSDWSWPSTQLWRHRGPRGSLEVWWGIAIVCCRSDLSLDASLDEGAEGWGAIVKNPRMRYSQVMWIIAIISNAGNNETYRFCNVVLLDCDYVTILNM